MIDIGEGGMIEAGIADWLSAMTGESHERDTSSQPNPTNIIDLRQAVRNSTRATARQGVKSKYTQGLEQGVRLRQQLFDPLLPYVQECSHLYIAPDAALSLLPFEALPLDSQLYVIDQYKISYLSTGRDVLRFHQDGRASTNPALVIAAPDYDLGSEKVRDFIDNYPFGQLSHVHKEGSQVAEILNVRPFFGKDALESVVKEHHSPAVLHLATHGFFLADAPPGPDPEELSFINNSNIQRLENLSLATNSMLRSGLALAGANTWAQGADIAAGKEDGLLTVDDIVSLDLHGTELVVLSACETGLGKVNIGEGVFGLRRAFAIAGAKTLVISLWKVPDDETRQIMELFYTGLNQGLGRCEALRQAKLKLRQRYPKQPFYWGAFICQGDPRPLHNREKQT